MTAALKPAAEEEADNMDFVDLCEELEALERRVMVQSLHIQQAKLEEGSGAYQPQEKLEEVGSMPAGEMAAAELPQEEAEQQFSEETADWSLQQSGHLVPQREIKIAGEIEQICPLRRQKCSREDCIQRASHWSSWTR
jgi:hypothetical protein